jgi:hypothetical protein
MTHADWNEVSAELEALLQQAGDDLPPDDRTNVTDLIEAGEFGVAFETLCTQLYEFDVAVPGDVRARLETLGRRLELDPALWKLLDG